MRRSIHSIGVLLAAVLLIANPLLGQTNSCQKISGHVSGQIIGPSALCVEDGVQLPTEIGSFTVNGSSGSFVACITGMQQAGNGSLRFQLQHTYFPNPGTSPGDTFTTVDRVVAAPIDRANGIYRIHNRADITGGTGSFADAFGFIRTHGTVNLQTGVVSVDYHGRICTP